MRVKLIAVGKLKDEAEREIVSRYLMRFGQAGRALGLSSAATVELPECRAATADLRKADEGARLERAVGEDACRIALDVGGRALSSEAFAQLLADERDRGRKTLAIVIGGPDGLSEGFLAGADLRLSLGPMILPHGLARAVIAEQLYRAATILAGHPYHRA